MFDNFFKKVLPDDPEEIDNATPLNELSQDIKAVGKYMLICIGANIFISTFLSGLLYQVAINMFKGKTIYLLSSFLYGITKVPILTIFILILLCIAEFRIYRATKKNYLMNYKDNYMKSKKETFGGAHFQTEEELEQNFNKYDSIMDTTENVFGMDKEGKIYTHLSKPGMNKNEIFFGAPGSGKSASIILTDILQILRRGDSLVVTDTKGDLYSQTSAIARKLGYKVRVLNLKSTEFRNSDGFNLFSCLKPDDPSLEAKAGMVASIIMENTNTDCRDDYWAKNEYNLFKCLILYVATCPRLIQQNRNNIVELMDMLTLSPGDLSVIFTEYEKNTPIRTCYDIFANAEERNQGSIINGAATGLNKIINAELRNVLSNDEINPILPMKEKCFYYVIVSDNDTTYKGISQLFFSLVFSMQCDYSDKLSREEKKNQKWVYYLLDEYKASGGIYGLPDKIATVRSRKICLTIILQDKGQLDTLFETEASTILNCCTVKGLLSANDDLTADYFSTLLGTQTIVSQNDRMLESSADLVHAHGTVQKTYSENQRPLMLPEELMNGKLERDELIYVISAEPPVKLKKYFSELGGDAIHPLLIESYELGEKKPHKYKPKWRKRLEDAEKEKEQAVAQKKEAMNATPSAEETQKFPTGTSNNQDSPVPKEQVAEEPPKKKKYTRTSVSKADASDESPSEAIPEATNNSTNATTFGENWEDEV